MTVYGATQGRNTKSVRGMENRQVVLSALLPENIAGRVQGSAQTGEDSGVEGTDERE